MIIENISVKGSVHIILFDTKRGIEKQNIIIPNMIVTAGCTYLAGLLGGTSGLVPMSHMAIGTGSSDVTSGDIKLHTEVMRSQVAKSVIQQSVQFDTTFVAHNTESPAVVYEIREAGIFNNQQPATGTMLCRTTFLPVNKEPQDTLRIIWTVQINNNCNPDPFIVVEGSPA